MYRKNYIQKNSQQIGRDRYPIQYKHHVLQTYRNIITNGKAAKWQCLQEKQLNKANRIQHNFLKLNYTSNNDM